MANFNPKSNGQVNTGIPTPNENLDVEKLVKEKKELEDLLGSVTLIIKLTICGISIAIVGVLVSVAGIMISSYFSLCEKNSNIHQFEYNYHHYQPY